jgi:hypothetical protein
VPKDTIVVREVGRPEPDYSLDFDLPEVPRAGDHVFVQRPGTPEPYDEQLIVQKVLWRLRHPDTGDFGSDPPKLGGLIEIVVECSRAIGPYSRILATRDAIL